MLKGIVFVTAGRWQMPAIEMAKELGFYTIAIDSNPDAPGLKISNFSIVIELNKITEILKRIDGLEVEVVGVVSYCSEVGVLTAAQIREYYDLGFPNTEHVSIFLNKSLQRKKLDEGGFINPKWIEINNTSDIDFKIQDFNFPLVVKPPDSSGSRGVSIVKSRKNIEDKINKALVFSTNKKILIEEFIDGNEFTIEVAAKEGKIIILLVTRKIKISDEIKTVASELWSVNPNEQIHSRLSILARQVFKLFGLKTGAGHLEAIINPNGEIYVVEAAIRGGGFNLANKMVKFSTGFDFCKWSIESETKNNYEPKIQFYVPSVLFFQPTSKGIIRKISGVAEANLIDGVDVELLISEGSELNDAGTDADRIYCAIIKSDSRERLQAKKDKVENMIKVEIQT
jgi:biotin carboxylase